MSLTAAVIYLARPDTPTVALQNVGCRGVSRPALESLGKGGWCMNSGFPFRCEYELTCGFLGGFEVHDGKLV